MVVSEWWPPYKLCKTLGPVSPPRDPPKITTGGSGSCPPLPSSPEMVAAVAEPRDTSRGQ